jgi:hypothetical protein
MVHGRRRGNGVFIGEKMQRIRMSLLSSVERSVHEARMFVYYLGLEERSLYDFDRSMYDLTHMQKVRDVPPNT